MAFENKPLTRRKALTGAAAISAAGVAACSAETTSKPATETAPAKKELVLNYNCLLYTSPSPRDLSTSRMPSSA